MNRGLFPVSVVEQSCRVRFVESNGSLVVSDDSMHRSELPKIFGGSDVERLTQLKLDELGFTPRNGKERTMLEFLNNPLVHRYPSGNSPARYFMEVIMDEHAILASLLLPNSKTSEHPHSQQYGILEDYHMIAGESSLRLNNKTLELKCGMSVEVPLNTLHQLQTGENPAFTLIIMKNAGPVDRENWHR